SCRPRISLPSGFCTTSSASITRIRHHGTRSDLAARRARAAMSACISTGAIPGKHRKRGRGGRDAPAGRTNVSDNALETPRAAGGRAPDVFSRGGWVPMRQHDDDELVDFVIVGTGAGGGTLACKLAEYGFSVVALDAGPYWRPLED